MGFERERKELTRWASLLYEKGFVAARSGNVALRVDKRHFLITAHDAYLGYLEPDDILLVDVEGNTIEGKKEITSEKKLYLGIYRQFEDIKIIMHSHPAFTVAFFSLFDQLEVLSFEERFYLGKVPVIPQETPTVTEVESVIKALESSNIVVLKNHGVVSIGDDGKAVFNLIELLERQARVNLLIKSIHVSKATAAGAAEKQYISSQKRCHLLSEEHRQRLVELVNNNEEVQELGKKYHLSCTLAVKNQDTQEAACFHYQEGRITKVDNNEDAEFVIIGREEILKKVFNRELDPFVASTQGKVKTKGDFSQMSKWYPVLVRTFKLWEEAPVE